MSEPFKTYEEAVMNDGLLNRCRKVKFTPEHTMLLMANRHQDLMKELTHLSMLVPRKIRLPDGGTAIYRCPDHLIPDPPEA